MLILKNLQDVVSTLDEAFFHDLDFFAQHFLKTLVVINCIGVCSSSLT